MPGLTRAFVVAAVAVAAWAHAPANAGFSLAGASSSGPPQCGDFFDKWDVAGAPAAILSKGGFGREIIAAQDCLTKRDVAMACKHWRGLIPVIDRTGPPLEAQRGPIQKLITDNACS